MDIYIIESGEKGSPGLIYFVETNKNVAIEKAKNIPSLGSDRAEVTDPCGNGLVYLARSNKDWVNVARWPVLRSDDDMAPKIRYAYVDAARQLHEDEGTIEIDNDAIVSVDRGTSYGGAYVAGWLWVDDSDANVCTKCRAELTDDGEGYDGKCGNCMDVEDPA